MPGNGLVAWCYAGKPQAWFPFYIEGDSYFLMINVINMIK